MANGSQNMTSYKVKTIASQYTSNGGQQPPNYFGVNTSGILMMNTTVNSNGQYKDWLFMDAYSGNDVGGGVAIGVNRQSLGAYIMRSAAARTSWAESAELIGTHNWRKFIFGNRNWNRSQLTISDSSWAVVSGIDVFGLSFKDSGLSYTPSGGSATTATDTGDWRAWLTCASDSNTVTLNMRIDGTWQASKFIGPLQGNADTATKLSNTPNNTTTFLRGDNTWSNTWIGTTPDIRLKSNTTTSYAILRLHQNNTDSGAVIFLNGSGRTDDGGTNMLTIRNDIGDLRLDNNTTNSGSFTAYNLIHISSTSSNRATLRLRTVANQPNDFWLGSNGADHWSLTSRNSAESYNFYIYSNKSGIGYCAGWAYDTGYTSLLHGCGISGGNLSVSGHGYFETSACEVCIKTNNAENYAILRLNTPSSNSAGIIFMNGASRTGDGGANMLTIRNNVTGYLRLDNANNIVNGTIHVYPGQSSYREGIRIHSYGSWSDITLCGNDNTGETGTSANSWFLGNNNGNMYITRNNSSGTGTASLQFVDNIMAYYGRGVDIHPTGGNYADGLRLHTRSDGAWAAITFCATDNTGHTGMTASSWFIGTWAGNFYIGKGDTGYGTEHHLRHVNNVWHTNSDWTFTGTVDFTKTNDQAIHIGTIRGKAYNNGTNQTGQYIHMYERVHIGSPSGWGSRNAPSYGLSTYGGAWLATDTGNVGIGCTDPGYKLDVANDARVRGNLFVSSNNATGGGIILADDGDIVDLNDAYCSMRFSYGVRIFSANRGGSVIHTLDNRGDVTFTAQGSNRARLFLRSVANVPNDFYLGANNANKWSITCRASDESYMLGLYSAEAGTWRMRWYHNGHTYADSYLHNAVWNDIAECRKSDETEPGRVIIPAADGKAYRSTERLQSGGRIISDTYGIVVGETNEAKTPIGLAGRVLAYPCRSKNEYHIGDAVCSAPNGTVDIMTRDEIMMYPERILGIVNEIPFYDIWDQSFTLDNSTTSQKIEVKGRIWIDIK